MPKHSSPALHVELLDDTGAPTWMSRDVQGLIELARAQQRKQRGAPQPPPELRPERSGGSGSAAGSYRGNGATHAAVGSAGAVGGAAAACRAVLPAPRHSSAVMDEEDDGESEEEGSEGGSSGEDEADVSELLAAAAAQVGALVLADGRARACVRVCFCLRVSTCVGVSVCVSKRGRMHVHHSVLGKCSADCTGPWRCSTACCSITSRVGVLVGLNEARQLPRLFAAAMPAMVSASCNGQGQLDWY